MRYTQTTLKKIEDLFDELDYTIRYEKGNFQSGYCLVENRRIAVVNRFFDLEARFNCLLDILTSWITTHSNFRKNPAICSISGPKDKRNEATFLGTGTSQGVPVIGCTCAVCRSDDPRDNRLRSSVLLQAGALNVLIDAGPDLRQQMLRARVDHLDAILLTHEHNDHVIGLDDIRPFNFRSGQPMTVYALPRVAAEVRKRFEYVFGEPIPGLPRIELKTLDEHTPLQLGEVCIQPIGVRHGRLPILGFRLDTLTYLTDVKTVDDLEFEKIRGTTCLIVNALHHEQHHAHLNLQEALDFIKRVQTPYAWLTHISHRMGLAGIEGPKLPPGVALAYDGLEIEF